MILNLGKGKDGDYKETSCSTLFVVLSQRSKVWRREERGVVVLKGFLVGDELQTTTTDRLINLYVKGGRDIGSKTEKPETGRQGDR